MPVPGLSDYGIGWQLGMTYGVYDFDGSASTRSSPPKANSRRS